MHRFVSRLEDESVLFCCGQAKCAGKTPAKVSCCAKAKAEGKPCAGCATKKAKMNCCAKAKAEGKACTKCAVLKAPVSVQGS